MQGFLFVLYILVLSGLIAAIGDRLGYRMGKLRLSWFNLRPRTTATLMTVVTGVLISGLTLGFLFFFNRSLVNGLFNYSRDVSSLQWQANIARQQLEAVQINLESVRNQGEEAQNRVTALLQEQKQLLTQRDQVSARLETATKTLTTTQGQLEAASRQLTIIEQQARQAQAQIQTLEAQKTQLESDRSRLELSYRQAQTALKALGTQKQQLEAEINRLSQVAERFRQGQVRILAGEVLATGVVEGGQTPTQIQQGLNVLLSLAEQQARRLGAKATPPLDIAIQLPKADATATIQELQAAGSWVVRLVSVSNRLVGESVPIIVDVTPNRLLFESSTVLASVIIPPNQTELALQEQLVRLFSIANLRSRQAGLLFNPLTGSVGEFSQVKLLESVEQLKTITTPVTVQVITTEKIYTAGPLQVDLAIRRPASQPEVPSRT